MRICLAGRTLAVVGLFCTVGNSAALARHGRDRGSDDDRAHLEECSANSRVGDDCEIAVRDLKPTQLTAGFEEVHIRAEKIAKKNDAKLADYLQRHITPLIIGPGGAFYLTNRHHLSLAMAEAFGDSARVPAHITDDWSHQSQAQFLEQMQKQSYIYLLDENGQGPLAVSELPKDIFGLRDDPFRALAWTVRKAGGYADTKVAHADFIWANYFRAHLNRADVVADFERATEDGTRLAKAPGASALPGFGRSDDGDSDISD